MSEFVLHPAAAKDLEEIWEYIAADSLDAADEKPLPVIAILHGRRNLRVIAAICASQPDRSMLTRQQHRARHCKDARTGTPTVLITP